MLAGTVHAAKGMEFAHAVVLAGGWKGRSADYAPEARNSFFEEERRLYYVAMTRARKTLILLDRRDASLPYARELERWSLRLRKLGVADGESVECADTGYAVLGMKELYIDFAGGKPEGHRIHRSLARLQAGDAVRLVRDATGHVHVLDCGGIPVARLSKAGVEYLERPHMREVDEVRVIAVVSRHQDDGNPEFRDRLAVPVWELPILEMRHRRVHSIRS